MSTNNVRTKAGLYLPADHFNEGEIGVYSGTGKDQVRNIYDTVPEVATPPTYLELQPYYAFSPQAVANDGVELHPYFGWSIDQFNKAIDLAHYAAEDFFLADKLSSGITEMEGTYEYPIPSGWRYLARVQRATNYPNNVGYSSENYDASQGLYVAAGNQWLSQAFVLADAMLLGSVRLHLTKVGSPSVNLTVAIQTNTSGLPSGTSAGTSGTVATATGVSTDGHFVTFTFARPVYLAAGTYHIVLSSSQAALDASNYVAWGHDGSSPSYTSGDAGKYGGAAWSAETDRTRIFWLAYTDREAFYEDVPLPDWRVIPGSKIGTGIASEGRPVRIWGQGQATVPTLDGDTLELPEAYTVAKATALVLGMQSGGEVKDATERMRWAQYWENVAATEMGKMRVSVAPNSRIVEAR